MQILSTCKRILEVADINHHFKAEVEQANSL